jgi:hypothetical protein
MVASELPAIFVVYRWLAVLYRVAGRNLLNHLLVRDHHPRIDCSEQ